MRDILFRGKTRRYEEKAINATGDKMTSNWVYGGISQNNSGGYQAMIYQQYPAVDKFPVYADTVGQYSGLLDGNSVKIFEDDIVYILYPFENKCYYAVKFMSGYYDSGVYPFIGWCLVDKNGDYSEALTEWIVKEHEVKVVGNIFDNPELLLNSECE